MNKVLLALCCIFLIGISVGCTQEDAEDTWTKNIYPATNNTYDIGSPLLQFQDGYFGNIWVSNNGSFGNVTSVFYYGNGSHLTGILTALPSTGNFTNINVTNNATVGNTVSTSNLSVSNVAVIGNVTPAALLTLASGNIAVGLAPLKFTAGPLLTNPVAGAMEFDGTGIYLTPTNHRRFISLASDSMIATTNTASLTDVVLWNGTINANELKVNRVYVIKGSGLYTTHDANDVCTINMTVDSVNIVSITTATASVTNQSWSFEVFFTVRAVGASGTISSHGDIETSTASSCTTWETISINTTAVNYITIKAHWSDTLNNIKLTQCWLATAD